ncbi:hypothetical protein DFJ74DRAFT_765063 [Hyaloraphidium curvatum]|nr:hypothetical protein DFJ74DRAFT_765063 [Hyaloraphidium curvatum]
MSAPSSSVSIADSPHDAPPPAERDDDAPRERPRVPPSMVSAVTDVYALICRRVRRPIDPDLRVGISIPQSVVDEARDAAGLAAVFVALVCMERAQLKADADEFKKQLNESRAAYAESLAQELVHTYSDRGELFVWVLANKWPDPIEVIEPPQSREKRPWRRTTQYRADGTEVGRQLTFTERIQRTDTYRNLVRLFGFEYGQGYLPMFSPGEDGNQNLIMTADGGAYLLPVSSALEKAVEIKADHFLADVAVQDCIDEIWRGSLMLRPTHMLPTYRAATQQDVGFGGILDGRLRIPRYQYFIEIGVFAIFVFNFTLVVNGRDKYPQIEEWLMWAQAIAYFLHELYQAAQVGLSIYFLNLWNGLDAIMYGIFITAFAIRMYAINQTDSGRLAYYNDMAYDLVSINAIFLWCRMLSIFSGYRYMGTSMLITKAMLKDSLLFLVLFALVLVGFAQTFVGLNPALAPGSTINFLLKAVLQAADYDMAETYHPIYGPVLFMCWLAVAGIVLMNLLIAIFNSSYASIVDNADTLYEYQFAVRVLELWKQADDRPFFPPLNLFDVLMFPLRPFPFFKPLEAVVWTVVTFPFALLIAVYETVSPPPVSALARAEQVGSLRIVSQDSDDADEVETQDEDKDLGRRVIERLDRMEDRQEKFHGFADQVDRVLGGLQGAVRKLEEIAEVRAKQVGELEGLLRRVLDQLEKKGAA